MFLATGTWSPTFLCNALFKKEGKHHVGIFMITHVEENVEPTLCEPDKCHGWDWYSMEELLNFKDNKFLTLQKLCDAYEEKNGHLTQFYPLLRDNLKNMVFFGFNLPI